MKKGLKSFMKLKEDINSLAIGCFDGMHLGHMHLLEKLSKNCGVLVIKKGQKTLLSPVREDFSSLDFAYIDLKSIKNLSGKDFLDKLCLRYPKLQTLVVGYDFTFAKDKSCKGSDIEKLSKLKAIIVPEFKKQGISVHSKTIKDLLLKGDLKLANTLLGRTFCIKGSVIKGQGLGKSKLLPTLNINSGEYFLPKEGVYASFTHYNSKSYQSATFIGRRSTDGSFSVETHIIGPKKLDAPSKLSIEFKKFLRSPQSFANLDDLKARILQDIEETKAYFKEN